MSRIWKTHSSYACLIFCFWISNACHHFRADSSLLFEIENPSCLHVSNGWRVFVFYSPNCQNVKAVKLCIDLLATRNNEAIILGVLAIKSKRKKNVVKYHTLLLWCFMPFFALLLWSLSLGTHHCHYIIISVREMIWNFFSAPISYWSLCFLCLFEFQYMSLLAIINSRFQINFFLL